MIERKVFYSAGSHGNFLRWVFDSYDNNEVLPLTYNKNGNSHNNLATKYNTSIIEVCKEGTDDLYGDPEQKYAIVWEGLDDFFYTLSCYTDRGGFLKSNGIDLLEQDLLVYEEKYNANVSISEIIKKHNGYDTVKQGNPPRHILRDYFMLSFYTYFQHDLWLKNEELKASKVFKINMRDILDYTKLNNTMYELFGRSLDIEKTHNEFTGLNIPQMQLKKIKKIIECIGKKENMKIDGLNIISEAYLLFLIEKQYFDVPMRIGNYFFAETRDILDYVMYFPDYLKQPNKLFCQYHEQYKRS